jgi:hypothetical protein
VRFGPEIDFRDLLEEHERLHGPLWKYAKAEHLDKNKHPQLDDVGNHDIQYADGRKARRRGILSASNVSNCDGHSEKNDRRDEVVGLGKEESEGVRRDTKSLKRGRFHDYWDSTPAERALYSKITKRIQDALEKLSAETIADLKELKGSGKFIS